MKQFTACLMNEWAKLARRKKYWVLLALGMGVSLLSVLIKVLVGRITYGSLDLTGLNTASSMMGLFVNIWIPLVSMMAVCDLFATEFQDLTIKATLLRPVHRFKVYCAKIGAVSLLALVYLMGLFLASTVMDLLVGGGFGGVGYAFFAYLLDWIPLIILILMAAFLNQCQKGSTMTMFLCIMVYIVLYVAGIAIPNLSGLLFTGYLTWHSLWLGHLLPVGAIFSKIALLLGYGLIFFSGGYLLFMKREV